MKTHQLAKELLKLPNVTLLIEGWVTMRGYKMTVAMTAYDPKKTAIIFQKRKKRKKPNFIDPSFVETFYWHPVITKELNPSSDFS